MATNRYIKKVNNENNKGLLFILLVLFTALGVAVYLGSFSYGRFATAAVILYAMSLNESDLLCLIMFAFPYSSMLKLSSETISIIPILYIIILFKIIGKRKISVSPLSLVCFMMLAVFQVLSIAVYEAVYTHVIASLLNVAFVMFAASHFKDDDETNHNLIARASLCFATGTTLLLLLCDIFPTLPSQLSAKQYLEQIATNRYSATVMDPNELSQIILVAIGLMIAILPLIEKKFGKISIIAMMLYIAITGIRTNSKSYVITLVALFVFLMFVYFRSIAKRDGANKAFAKFLPILILTIVGCIFLVIYVIIPVFESRSGENVDLLTGRDGIWQKYWYALEQRFDVSMIGCGGGNVTHVMKLIGHETKGVPHNTYLEYLIQFGFIGIILIVAAWKNMFSQIRNKLTTYFAIPLVAFLITAFAISVNANDCPYVLLALLALPLPKQLTAAPPDTEDSTATDSEV